VSQLTLEQTIEQLRENFEQSDIDELLMTDRFDGIDEFDEDSISEITEILTIMEEDGVEAEEAIAIYDEAKVLEEARAKRVEAVAPLIVPEAQALITELLVQSRMVAAQMLESGFNVDEFSPENQELIKASEAALTKAMGKMRSATEKSLQRCVTGSTQKSRRASRSGNAMQLPAASSNGSTPMQVSI